MTTIKRLRKFVVILPLVLLCFATSVNAETITVNSLPALVSAAGNAEDGDIIVLRDSTYYATGEIDFEDIYGNVNDTITIKSETVGGAVIDGVSGFKVHDCAYLKFDGFKFVHAAEDKSFAIYGSQSIRVTNCTFDLEENGSKNYWLYASGTMPNGEAPHHIRFDHNDFYEKYDEGCFIVVYGPSDDITKHVRIDHNRFRGHYFTGSNGGEAIRFGDSNRQNHSSYAIIESNLFENCEGDPEVISFKTTNGIIRRNTLSGCNGSITLRHGDSCRVESNYIMNGDGGIRFYGDNQEIIGNYIFNNDNIKPSGEASSARGALVVGGGDVDDLANGENTYDRPSNCLVAYNTLAYNLGKNLDIGVFGGNYAPENLRVMNNLIISDEEELVTYSMTPENPTFEGNVLWGTADRGDMPGSGYTEVDPDITDDAFQVYHLNSSSPLINAAVPIPDLAYATDIDGQPRDDFDIGSDESSFEPAVHRPLSPLDVGPVEGDSTGGPDIYCDTVDDIYAALQNASPGDRIILAPGTYEGDNSDSGESRAIFYASVDGTAEEPIQLISQYPDNKAVLRGETMEHHYVLYITGDHWIVDGLELTNGNKGVMMDNSHYTTLRNLDVYGIGQEGIHLRDGSAHNLVEDSHVYETGLVIPDYGEGVYVGSDDGKWDTFEYDDNYNIIRNCVIGPNVSAESVDIKEGTVGTIIEYCTFNGTGITGEHYADSFIDAKGDSAIIRYNTGYRNGNANITDAFQVHEHTDGWGFGNDFYGNELYLDTSAPYVIDVSSGSAMASDNIRHPSGNMYKGNVYVYSGELMQAILSSNDVTASSDDGNIPENTLDGDYDTRWSAEGDGEWIQYDLGSEFAVADARFAFFNGDNRTSYFDIQVSSDGESWESVLENASSSGYTNELQSFDLDESRGRYVRYVGHGNSINEWNSITETEIWVRIETGIHSDEQTALANEFYLGDNYPNPFNPVTSMEFQLPASGHVELTVYNARGQQLRALIAGEMTAGVHRVRFDGNDLPSGIYFYVLRTENKVMSKKMVLLK
ncbi:MAG: discoidin domain-containing protein [Candidatus Marinimicrobia bacterium]|nr:discoidin domain-containing protein [Candidatus Neomarinimicrobiota bacterium]MCF7828909.1 discoidin domain-containing protein [Candidatus Neomarinimicrobiota bacterium]MCF7879869.1 discoidin domain-containing protein [Candidatus Neomarinimicrobiota bacterium]